MENKKETRIIFRCTKAFKQQAEKNAKKESRKLSNYIEHLVNEDTKAKEKKK